MRGHRTARRQGTGLLLAGLVLLLSAWAVGNAPFTSPDESGHFVRAASLVRGQLVGDPVPALVAPPPGREGTRLLWQRGTTRSVTLPARLDPAGLDCNALQPDRPATCSQTSTGRGSTRLETPVGTYDVLPSLAPGAATLVVTSSATGALRAARLAGAALALALIALGLSAGAGFWARLGLGLALTPGALFVLSSVGPNAPEIAGSCALSLALFRFGLTGEAGRRSQLAMAAGGFAIVASRPTSIAWLAVAVLAVGLCRGDLRAGLVAVGSLRRVVLAWTAGIVVSVLWATAVQPSPPHGLSSASARAALDFIPEMVREWVGVFGALDTRPPWWLAAPLLAALTLHLLWALARGGRGARRALALLICAALVLPAAFNATVLWFTGFGLQGRHVMALAVMAPILAGVALDAREVRPGRVLRWALPSVWAATQIAFWLFNAHRHTVGASGSWSFLGDQPAWLPGPWLLWLAVAAAGAALCGLALARDD